MGPSWRSENRLQAAAILGGTASKLGKIEKYCSGNNKKKSSYRTARLSSNLKTRIRKPGIRPTQVGLTEPQVALKLGSSWVQVGGRETGFRPQQYWAERLASWESLKRTVPAI
ncbi:hypothetical protein [Photorhabdus heterorhabditis]|uniref:hypothetical protein n=1 Tax=Photorhabdus heterorhabditis TaxID=880156 RepID=UPI001562199E|nr:hypothetical protein [Photorhabdus heterorhabditis]NRN30812.1 hypothetical protein [Photorhabdus heterorhabditis subsp. aluminescens]